MNRSIAFLTAMCFSMLIVTVVVVSVVMSAVSVADVKPAAGDTIVMADPVKDTVVAGSVAGSPGNIVEGGAPGNAGAPEPEPVTCATEFQDLVGTSAASMNKSRFGDHPWRILHPGQMVTQEYQEGRLNITVDAKQMITAVTCG